MADWKVFIAIKDSSEGGEIPVPQARVIVGSLGEFIADNDGVAEVETELVLAGTKMLEDILITPPAGWASQATVLLKRILEDNKSYTATLGGYITQDE